MKIECPNCQEECISDLESIPPEGMEINCPHCQFSFIMRSHASEKGSGPRDASSPVPQGSVSQVDGRMTGNGEHSSELYEAILRTRRTIPNWMVHAYETGIVSPAPDPGEESIPLRNLDPLSPGTERDIPILVDDALVENASFPQDGFEPPPIQARKWKPGAGARARNKSKRWPLLIALLAVVLIALFLTYKAGLQKIVGKAAQLRNSIATILPLKSADEGRLHLSNLNSDFVSRGRGKTAVFVIDGKVTNGYKKVCASIQVKGILFDERGKRAAEETVYCGNTLTKEELRSVSEKNIKEIMQNPVGSSLSNLNIKPGKSISFMLIFFNPPEKLSEFSIEIAGYSLRQAEME